MKPTAANVVGYFFGGAVIGCLVVFWVAHRIGIPDWIPILLAAGAVVGGSLGVVVGVRQARQEQHYQEELTGLAEVAEFRHTPTLDRKELGPLLRLPILKSCSVVRHRLVRLDETLPLEMIDVGQQQGSGRHPYTVWRTVVVFPGGAAGLPDFTLRPLFGSPRPLFGLLRPGGVTFDLPAREEDAAVVAAFGKYYLLAPPDVPADEAAERALAEQIRWVFSLNVLRYFADNPGWDVQACDGHLALWQGKLAWPVEHRPTLLVDALRVQEMLTHEPAGGRTLVPGGYRRDMYHVADTVGAVSVGAVFGGFLGAIVGLILLFAISAAPVNLWPGVKAVLAWSFFLGCPLLCAWLGGYLGYRLRRGRPARPREG
jgi:hypothetical protein